MLQWLLVLYDVGYFRKNIVKNRGWEYFTDLLYNFI